MRNFKILGSVFFLLLFCFLSFRFVLALTSDSKDDVLDSGSFIQDVVKIKTPNQSFTARGYVIDQSGCAYFNDVSYGKVLACGTFEIYSVQTDSLVNAPTQI